ncbi:heat shock 70 kDa protein 12A-like [Saccostrea echinata]|uniref:heat shock 70 kDa protein 12A-like n=1 Tax=Saccostrea echinata TaxID=191078 RepID=UPI002A7EB5BE|nr:heat shock 70 kDa protein 12A-like [Saccostrea echinata]
MSQGRVSKTDSLLVMAIDFGTTYSGYAFQFRHDYESDRIGSIFANTSWVAEGGNGLMSWKTPTTLLLNPDDSFNSFGYEAEEVYQELIENEEHHDFHYFRRFKMMLHNKMIMNRDVIIEDSGGRGFPARTVFRHSIDYLKKHFFKTIEERALNLEHKDIQWVLTVPAIWNEPAKQFMREAAVEAGIPSDNLQLALEPEAASLFCKYVPAEKQSDEDGQNMKIVPFSIGTRYMILDLGGGTGDVTVHEVVDENSLREINVASGGAWGGTNVDKAYYNMLKSIFGEDVLMKFKTERRTDMLEFQRDFEMKKRHIRDKLGQNTRPVIISVPALLSEYVRELKGMSLQDIVANSEFADKIKIKPGNKLAIARELMETLFDDPREQIVTHVRNILENQENENRISAILMVGGFSTSNIIVDAVKQAFPELRVVVPPEPGLAVVKGAVLCGHAPLTISSRVCKYTYGVAVYDNFDENKHPLEKRVEHENEVLCKDVFSMFIQAGQSVDVNKSVDESYDVPKPHAPVSLQIYATPDKNPLFTTDEHCEMLGRIIIKPPASGWQKGAKIKISMKFGGTEFEVHATDPQNPETVYSTKCDFLL